MSTALPTAGEIWSLASDPLDADVVCAVVDGDSQTRLYKLAIALDGEAVELASVALSAPGGRDPIDVGACVSGRCVATDGAWILVHSSDGWWALDDALGETRRVDQPGLVAATLVGGQVAWLDDDRVRRVNPATGASAAGWPKTLRDVGVALATDGTWLYAAAGGEVTSFGASGAMAWRSQVCSWVQAIAADPDAVLASCGGEVSLWRNGAALWSQPVALGLGSPLLTPSYAAVALEDRALRLAR